MMSTIKKLGLRPMGLRPIGLRSVGRVVMSCFFGGALLACSSTQKLSYSQMQQRVPLSEEQKEQQVIQTTKYGTKILNTMYKKIGISVQKVAQPEFEINISKVSTQNYAASKVAIAMAGLSTLVAVAATTVLLPSLVGAATVGGVAGAAAVSMTPPIMTTAMVATSSNVGAATGVLTSLGFESLKPGTARFSNKDRSSIKWPHRIKIVYKAVHKSTAEEQTGHCSAYFFDTNHNRVSIDEVHGGHVLGFTTPFEIDGCTHEHIFPENKRGRVRIGGTVDPADMLLGQAKVVANGNLSVKLVGTDGKANAVLFETNITSHKTKYSTTLPLN